MASLGFMELLRLADLAKARQTGRHRSNQAQWLGVVFEVAGQRLVAPMGEVSEVLSVPEMTTVPLVKPWMLGIANVRGRLLPLVDLPVFLGITSTMRLRERKVIVIDQGDIFTGFLVDKVLGISQFAAAQYQGESLPENSPFAPYGHGKFVKDKQDWFIFMPSRLVQDPQYMHTSIQ